MNHVDPFCVSCGLSVSLRLYFLWN